MRHLLYTCPISISSRLTYTHYHLCHFNDIVGDEVILFEPFFDLYKNQIKLAGGTPVYVPLTFVPYDDSENVISGGEWVLESDKLTSAISSKTKAIILNSPHNPR